MQIAVDQRAIAQGKNFINAIAKLVTVAFDVYTHGVVRQVLTVDICIPAQISPLIFLNGSKKLGSVGLAMQVAQPGRPTSQLLVLSLLPRTFQQISAPRARWHAAMGRHWK